MANIHIADSSLMSRGEFLSALADYPNDATEEELTNYWAVVNHRSEHSLLTEWAAHKLLYQLGMFRSHTESVDLEYPQAWYFSLAYFLVGGFALIFYK